MYCIDMDTNTNIIYFYYNQLDYAVNSVICGLLTCLLASFA